MPGPAQSAASTGACSTTDINTFYTDCLNASSPSKQNCTGSDLSSAACFACLATPNTASSWGAVIIYGTNDFFALNLGGCYAADGEARRLRSRR